MAPARPTALIAEDEPLLAQSLTRLLAEIWPQLQVLAVVEDGLAAIERALELTPDVLFLDIKMPGRNGLEVAESVTDDWPDRHAEPLFVFVTAHDEFALRAFEHAAVDYLLKPATPERLRDTVRRLQKALDARTAVPAIGDLAKLFQRMQALAMSPQAPVERISVIRAGVGNTVRMIPVAEVICFEAADKYVTVTTAGGEALVRMSLRELVGRIDGAQFIQVHRGVMVNSTCVTSAARDEFGHLTLVLRGLARPVKVSRAFAHLFRPM
ncbi:MAG: response regulator transcription factor [Gammaproteobacteria bacterium]|nr:response regulator transcription factor [Gammaproteobacteria bacterium]